MTLPAHETEGTHTRIPKMTRVDEEHTTTTTTTEQVEPAKPRVVNLNVNTKGDTISVNQPEATPDEASHTTTTTTHSETHQER